MFRILISDSPPIMVAENCNLQCCVAITHKMSLDPSLQSIAVARLLLTLGKILVSVILCNLEIYEYLKSTKLLMFCIFSTIVTLQTNKEVKIAMRDFDQLFWLRTLFPHLPPIILARYSGVLTELLSLLLFSFNIYLKSKQYGSIWPNISRCFSFSLFAELTEKYSN